jgi:hypothetical protein
MGMEKAQGREGELVVNNTARSSEPDGSVDTLAAVTSASPKLPSIMDVVIFSQVSLTRCWHFARQI